MTMPIVRRSGMHCPGILKRWGRQSSLALSSLSFPRSSRFQASIWFSVSLQTVAASISGPDVWANVSSSFSGDVPDTGESSSVEMEVEKANGRMRLCMRPVVRPFGTLSGIHIQYSGLTFGMPFRSLAVWVGGCLFRQLGSRCEALQATKTCFP